MAPSSLVDDDRLADPELLPEDLLRKRVLDELLDRPAQRPRAELGLVALARRRTPWPHGVSSRPMPWPSSCSRTRRIMQVDDLDDLFHAAARGRR